MAKAESIEAILRAECSGKQFEYDPKSHRVLILAENSEGLVKTVGSIDANIPLQDMRLFWALVERVKWGWLE